MHTRMNRKIQNTRQGDGPQTFWRRPSDEFNPTNISESRQRLRIFRGAVWRIFIGERIHLQVDCGRWPIEFKGITVTL